MSLFGDDEYQGFAQRNWAWGEWRRENPDATFMDTHAWHTSMTHDNNTDVEFCRPTILSATMWCPHEHDEGCLCVSRGILSRGACLLCDWEGPIRECDNEAVEDALDHSWPGWRDLPVVGRVPEDRKKHPAWLAYVNSMYPPGWVEQGGPIKTARIRQGNFYGSRHVPLRTPFGGYDVGVKFEPDTWVEPKFGKRG